MSLDYLNDVKLKSLFMWKRCDYCDYHIIYNFRVVYDHKVNCKFYFHKKCINHIKKLIKLERQASLRQSLEEF